MSNPLTSLIAAFDNLPALSAHSGVGGANRLSACPIPGFTSYRLAKDANGTPSLLISVADWVAEIRPAPILLEHLAVQHDVDCRISRPDGNIEEGRFTILRFTGANRSLQVYFLRVVGTLAAMLGERPSRQKVVSAVDRLVELFRAMSQPPRGSVQGLWAELCLIARAQDPSRLVEAWHETPEDRYDFNAGSQRIEVKSVSGAVRRHHFSLEQLRPPAGTSVLIASMLVDRSGAGTSVAELVDEVRSRVSNNPLLVMRVDQIVGLTLGEGLRHAVEERFDRESAEDSLAFFEPHNIPSVSQDLPPEVSDVHFRSDLTRVPTADLAHCRVAGGLFRAVLRRSFTRNDKH